MVYKYAKASSPDLDYIESEVSLSAMTNKNLTGMRCRWDEEPAELCIEFDAALSAGDKTILDGIVAGAGGD